MKSVLLYYKYVHIEDPAKFRNDQERLCTSLTLKGRILIAKEGINGTVSGNSMDIEEYKAAMWAMPEFCDIEFKEYEEENDVFKKLSIKVRQEIVSLQVEGLDITSEHTKKGTYLEPQEFNNLIKSDEEYYIIDMRNNYESYIGKFRNSIALDIDNFRDLPTKGIKQIEHLKEKRIVAVCTGGIRCEKASAYLIKNGFRNVSQLHGGIIKYGKEFPDEGYEGKCYVFDSRIAVAINTPDHKKIIAKCYHCNKPCDDYVNCCNAECNKQFVCCKSCEKRFEQGCSFECQEKSRFKKETLQ